MEVLPLPQPVAAVARVDPAALAVMAVTVLVPLLPAAAAAAAREDRRLLLAQREQLLLAAPVVQGELQALGALEVRQLQAPLPVLMEAAAVVGLVLLHPTDLAL